MKFDITAFDPNKEELTKIREEVSKIEADPAKITKEELSLVNTYKNKLVKARTNIQRIGKEKRGEALKFQKDVIAYERELIAIIEPEEQRLKKIEKDTKEYAIRKERMKTLPEYKEKLDSIGDDITITDDELLAMDPTDFTNYYNQRLADKVESDKEKEKAKQAETREFRIKRLLEVGMKEDGAFLVTATIKKSALTLHEMSEKEFMALLEEVKELTKKEKEKEIYEAKEKARKETEQRLAQEKAAEEEARQAAEKAAKEKAEEEKAMKKEQQRRKEAEEEYQKWLKENDFDEATDKVVHEEDFAVLYRKISTYRPS